MANMSNGGGAASSQVTQSQSNEKKGSEGEEGDAFGRAVAKIAVAQICESEGFQSCQKSALDTFADIAIRYLQDLGKSAHSYANIAGRTDSNVFDVILAMEDMNEAQGFSGASHVINRKISDSATVREIVRYTNRAEEIPFARPVPRFPVLKKSELMPSFAQMGETPSNSHIPPWLPAFPDPHTYKHTPVWNERKTDPRMDKMEQARQRRKAERSLLNLQQRLASTAGGGASSSSAHFTGPMEIDGKGKNPNSKPNPFLAPPVSADERHVSPVRIPDRVFSKDGAVLRGSVVEKGNKMPSVLEAFAPAIEAAKQGLDRAQELVRNPNGIQVLPDERPFVQFKFDFGKKAALAAHLTAAGQRNRGELPPNCWFGRDDEKDEKKRRAEQILKAAMENPQDLVQL